MPTRPKPSPLLRKTEPFTGLEYVYEYEEFADDRKIWEWGAEGVN